MENKLITLIGMCLVIYVAGINIISTAKVAFSIPTIIIGLIIIIYGLKGKTILKYIKSRKYFEQMYKFFKIGAAALILLIVIIEGIIISCPKYDTSECDYIIVLGAGLSKGYYPSVILADRLDTAMSYMDKYGDSSNKIVVSGGQGSDEKLSEAEVMKRYLMDKGIPEKDILVENRSSNTSENFKFSKALIEADSGKSISDVNVKVVTTSFHAFRSKLLAEKNGYTKVTNYCGKTIWYLVPVNYFREAFAVVKSVIFD